VNFFASEALRNSLDGELAEVYKPKSLKASKSKKK
jgi:hypothetical protein